MGFEPTRLSPYDFKSYPLDHSGILALIFLVDFLGPMCPPIKMPKYKLSSQGTHRCSCGIENINYPSEHPCFTPTWKAFAMSRLIHKAITGLESGWWPTTCPGTSVYILVNLNILFSYALIGIKLCRRQQHIKQFVIAIRVCRVHHWEHSTIGACLELSVLLIN